jgi:hypothetical protein
MNLRRYLAVPLLAASLALAGGSTLTGCASQSIADQAPETVLTAEKALTVAHLALQRVGDTLVAASTRGALRGEAAATAKVWYDRADDALRAADTFDTAANTNGILNQIRIAHDAIFQANAIISPKP